jgi:hypothetical protein
MKREIKYFEDDFSFSFFMFKIFQIFCSHSYKFLFIPHLEMVWMTALEERKRKKVKPKIWLF